MQDFFDERDYEIKIDKKFRAKLNDSDKKIIIDKHRKLISRLNGYLDNIDIPYKEFTRGDLEQRFNNPRLVARYNINKYIDEMLIKQDEIYNSLKEKFGLVPEKNNYLEKTFKYSLRVDDEADEYNELLYQKYLANPEKFVLDKYRKIAFLDPTILGLVDYNDKFTSSYFYEENLGFVEDSIIFKEILDNPTINDLLTEGFKEVKDEMNHFIERIEDVKEGYLTGRGYSVFIVPEIRKENLDKILIGITGNLKNIDDSSRMLKGNNNEINELRNDLIYIKNYLEAIDKKPIIDFRYFSEEMNSELDFKDFIFKYDLFERKSVSEAIKLTYAQFFKEKNKEVKSFYKRKQAFIAYNNNLSKTKPAFKNIKESLEYDKVKEYMKKYYMERKESNQLFHIKNYCRYVEDQMLIFFKKRVVEKFNGYNKNKKYVLPNDYEIDAIKEMFKPSFMDKLLKRNTQFDDLILRLEHFENKKYDDYFNLRNLEDKASTFINLKANNGKINLDNLGSNDLLKYNLCRSIVESIEFLYRNQDDLINSVLNLYLFIDLKINYTDMEK